MKFLFTFLIIIPFAIGFAQNEDINKFNSLNQREGKWVGWYDDGTVRYIGQFSDGNPKGEFVYYYENEDVKSISYFSDQGNTLRSTIYHVTTKKVMGKGKYYRNIDAKDTTYLKDSVWSFFDPKGNIISEETFRNGKKNGIAKVYYLDGKLASETMWVNGNQEGPYKEYFPNGKLKEEGVMKDRNFIGMVIRYHSTGAKFMQGKYVAGVKNGKWLIFDSYGKLKNTYYYKNGKLLENEEEIQKFRKCLEGTK